MVTRSALLRGRRASASLHVVEAPVDEIRDDAALTAIQRGIRDGFVADARERWDTFITGPREASHLRLDVDVAHRLVRIRQPLDQHSSDLLVLGAFGEEKPRVGMGTLASGVCRVPTDVLILRDSYRDAISTVVVGIDFSPACGRAMEAASLIAHGEAAKLYAVHVVPDRVGTIASLRTGLGPDLDALVRSWPRSRDLKQPPPAPC